MAATAAGSRSASENLYRSLRSDFDAAYQNMMNSSREFNAVLTNVSAGLSPQQRRARTASAAQAYEEAHERFMTAVRNLNEFMIRRIISSRSAIQVAAPKPRSGTQANGFSSAPRP